MNATVELSGLSLESAEIGPDDMRAEDAIGEVVDNPIHSKQFDDMQRILTSYAAIVDRGYVCRGDMQQIEDLAIDYPLLARLFCRYPINSFTEDPSRVNYEVSNEGFVRTAYDAIVKAFKEVIAFLLESFKRLWKFLTDNAQRTAAVDDMAARLTAIQRYISEVDKVMSTGPLTTEYRAVLRRGFDTEHHNLSKKWNGFKQLLLTEPAKGGEYLDVISGVIKTKIPPFVESVDQFLTNLSTARTETDVMSAIARMELVDMNSAALTKCVSEMGYNFRGAKTDPKVTNFQGMANHMRNSFRSWGNDRNAILDRSSFQRWVLETTVTPWAKNLNETIAWSTGRTGPILKRLGEFTGDKLEPGMEQVYIDKLVPFIMSLTSILQGFTALEQSMGMLVTTRDNVVIAISKAALNVAKNVDGYVVKNKARLPVVDTAVIWKYRKSMVNEFKL